MLNGKMNAHSLYNACTSEVTKALAHNDMNLLLMIFSSNISFSAPQNCTLLCPHDHVAKRNELKSYFFQTNKLASKLWRW